MVYFYCNACGDSLKKNQVQKHYQQRCRNCNVLSCVDCGQEFHGLEYEKHTKCISEEEKYSGKNFKPKPNANKGELKQEQWIDQVQQAISKVEANPRLKSLLEQLKNYPNIPRKRAKFENFLANSLRVRDQKLASLAWEAVSHELTPTVAVASVDSSHVRVADQDDVSVDENKINAFGNEVQEHTKELNGDGAESSENRKRRTEESESAEDLHEVIKKKKKKRKKDEEKTEVEEPSANDDGDSCASFKWDAAIIGVLKRAPGHQLALKKLRKKVLGEYNARGGDGKVYTEEKLLGKFMRKVSRNQRLKIHKDVVQLVH